MTPETPLLRQVHPNYFQNQFVSDVVFRPTEADQGLLSVDEGDVVSAEEAYLRCCAEGRKCIGVIAVSHGECQSIDLPVLEDPDPPHPGHCFLDFRAFSKQVERDLRKKLLVFARKRGWLFKSPDLFPSTDSDSNG